MYATHWGWGWGLLFFAQDRILISRTEWEALFLLAGALGCHLQLVLHCPLVASVLCRPGRVVGFKFPLRHNAHY